MKRDLKSINWPAFIFSLFFVVYGLWNISNTLWIQIVMAAFGFFVEWEAQQVWGLSFTYPLKSFFYWAYKAQYIWYFLIFAMIPGTGFFMTEIVAQEAVATKVERIETNNQTRIDVLNGLIRQKTEQLSLEGKTSARTEYYKIQAKIDEYNNELKGLINQGKTEVKIKIKPKNKDMFANASKALWNIPKERLIFIMFATALLMVYTGLMRKPMKFKNETNSESSEVTSEPIHNKPEFLGKNPVTSDTLYNDRPNPIEIKPVTPEQQEMIDFTNALWGNSEERMPQELTPIDKINMPDRKRRRYSDYLKEIGAISKTQGIPCKALWTKNEIIDHIKNNVA